MGEALKKVTQELGLNNNKDKTALNPSEDTLEKALKEEEAELARELRIGRAEETIAKRQVRIKQLRELLGKGGTTMAEEGKTEEEKAAEELKAKTERIDQAKALYNSCIEAGGEPKQCAEMVAGLMPTPTTAGAPPATSITELVSALKALDELRGERGGELKEVLEKLAAKVEAVGNRPPADPVAMAQQQAQAIKSTYDALTTLGIIKEPVVTTSDGKSLEVVKEEHRHDEKMEEIHADREYKKDLTEIASEIPERVGRGIGGQFSEEEGSSGGGGGELEYITCQEEGCGAKIYITPTTGSQVTCPKCSTVYSRKGTVETK